MVVSAHSMTVVPDGYTSGTVTNATESFRWLFPFGNRGVRFDVERESEIGACTLAMNVMWVNQETGDVNALLDQAGAAIALNDFADGETGKRFIVIHEDDILANADADGVLAVGNNTYYRQALPFELQLDFVHGGTAVSNVFNCQATWLP